MFEPDDTAHGRTRQCTERRVSLRLTMSEASWGRWASATASWFLRTSAAVAPEGGPHLLTTLLSAGAVDELCATTVPQLVGGPYRRITEGRRSTRPST